MRIVISSVCLIFLHSICFAQQRIISLAPSITEMIYALEASEKLVGVTKHCNYPKAAQNKPKIGTFIQPSLEAILSLKPDLVVALEKATPLFVINRLQQMDIKVIVLKNGGINTIWENLFLLGKILKKEKKAKILINTLQTEIQNLTQRVKNFKKIKVFWQIGMKPLVTCGQSSYHHELITLAGGINIVQEKNAYCVYSLEKVLKARPDVIIVSNMTDETAQAFWQRFGITNRIYIANSDIFDRPSPRVAKALKMLIKFLHPEVAVEL